MKSISALCLLVCIGQTSGFLTSQLPLLPGRARVGHLQLRALGDVAAGTKVVVAGGNGFVGSRVCQQLAEAGCEVVSISRTGSTPAWAANQEWASKVTWTAGDVTSASAEIEEAMQRASAVVSCVGVIGGSDADMKAGNGDTTEELVKMAQKTSVPRFVYVSVSKAVPDAVEALALKGYFAGKRQGEAAVKAAYGDQGVCIGPTFIYGGEEFSATPPRVAEWYGRFVERGLSLDIVQPLTKALLPSALGLALLPPVWVNNVAAATAGAAVGKVQGEKIDGTAEINAAAQMAES